MSLQIWLPLNGNLNNQGLSNITLSQVGTPTIDNAGKIGQCYSFDGNSYFQSSENFLSNFTECSFSCWVKDTYTGSSYMRLFGIGEHTRVHLDVSGTGKPRFFISINGTSSSYWAPMGTTDIRDSKWHHICGTFNTTEAKIYVDGVCQATSTTGSLPSAMGGKLYIASIQNGLKLTGSLNDIRIYDHCLSAKEVKELSKGLVLHCKLENTNIYIPPGNPNLFIGSNFSSNITSNIVANNSTDWTKYLRYYNGSASIHSFADGIDTITLNATSNLGIAFVRKATDIDLDPNSYYTISCEAQCTTKANPFCIGTSYYNTSNSWVWRDGSNGVAFNAVNTWQTFTLTFKPDSNIKYICYCFTVKGTSGGTNTVKIRNCKLEKGSSATAYMLNPADEGYNIPEMPYNKEYDVSGYNNSISIIGTLTETSDTPRYNSAAHISTTSTKIQISNLFVDGFADSYSISWWGKVPTYSGKMMWGFPSKLNGIYNGTLWNTGDGSNNPLYKPGTTTQVSAPTSNVWHHFVMVGNGTQCKVYKDGALWGVAKTYKSLTGTSIYINGWNSATNYSYDNLSISDFRLYSTALSDADILELYNVSATIDNKGNIYARELVEE